LRQNTHKVLRLKIIRACMILLDRLNLVRIYIFVKYFVTFPQSKTQMLCHDSGLEFDFVQS